MIARFILLAALVGGAIFAGMTNPTGTIAFGTGYDNGASSIQGPGTVFPVNGPISCIVDRTLQQDSRHNHVDPASDSL